MIRPSWDHYFMLIAKLVSTRSTCNSRPTGAVIVDENHHIISTGYNGALPGHDQCSDLGEEYCFRREIGGKDSDKYNVCKSNHSEANALANAERSVRGCSLYVTLSPCYVCFKLLAAAGIRKIFYEHSYKSIDKERDEFWDKAIRDSDIEVYQQITIPEEVYKSVKVNVFGITSERRMKSR